MAGEGCPVPSRNRLVGFVIAILVTIGVSCDGGSPEDLLRDIDEAQSVVHQTVSLIIPEAADSPYREITTRCWVDMRGDGMRVRVEVTFDPSDDQMADAHESRAEAYRLWEELGFEPLSPEFNRTWTEGVPGYARERDGIRIWYSTWDTEWRVWAETNCYTMSVWNEVLNPRD
jgi:hypothetical protein